MSWALLLDAPAVVVLSGWSVVQSPPRASAGAGSAFAHLAVVSTFLASFAWCTGSALGPLTRVSQVQLVQPGLSLSWVAVLLGESVTAMTALGGLAVIACAGLIAGVRRLPRRTAGTSLRT